MAKAKTPNINGFGLKSPIPPAHKSGVQAPFSKVSQKTASGDQYGSGVRNPMAKLRDSSGVNPVSKSKLGIPPKKLA